MSKTTINLYNHFHNGDVLFARMVTNLLKNKFKVRFYHNLTPPLFQDCLDIEEISGIPSEFKHTDHFSESLKFDAINTWIGQGSVSNLNRVNDGCSFENHMELAKEIISNFDIQISDIEEHLPTINYSNLPNFDLINYKIISYKEKFEKIVLSSNGDVHSGQSHNFDFYPLITQLSSEFPNILFICSKSVNCINDNMVNVDTITQVLPDLLYISQISTFCDVIIGRASGPYCFAQVKENLLDVNKTFISFNFNPNEGKFYSNLKANFIWSNNFDYTNMFEIIKNNLIN